MMAQQKPLPSLIERLPPVRGRLTPGAPLSAITWFRVGGPAEVLFRPADREDLPAAMVSAYAYGEDAVVEEFIEGTEVAGRPVLVVEDTSTTGGSVLTAVEAVREAGGDIVGVAVIVDRDTGAREKIEAEGLAYRAAFSLTDLGLA